jgi:hypothetical protein
LGWKAKRTTSLLPVAGDVFTIDFPLYRTRLPDKWASGEFLAYETE